MQRAESELDDSDKCKCLRKGHWQSGGTEAGKDGRKKWLESWATELGPHSELDVQQWNWKDYNQAWMNVLFLAQQGWRIGRREATGGRSVGPFETK